MSFPSKESLYKITELSTDKIANLTDEEMAAYCEQLHNAVNLFPVQKNHLEQAFAKMEYAPTLQWLKSISNTLTRIYADNLVRQCKKQLAQCSDPENIRHDRLKNFIDFFTASLTMFYADVAQVLKQTETATVVNQEDTDAKRIRVQLATIDELNQTAIDKIPNSKLSTYIKNLHHFCHTGIDNENGLRGAFRMKNYASVISWLDIIEASLIKIHADNLAEECKRQINANNDYAAIRQEKFELVINYICSALSMLRTDIESLKGDISH
jgi:hypothetical protein